VVALVDDALQVDVAPDTAENVWHASNCRTTG
jgi:hypothetical protein